MGLPLVWEPMGELAAMARLESEDLAVRVAARLRGLGLPGAIDVVAAFESVAVYFDVSDCLTPWWEALPKSIDDLDEGVVRAPAHHVVPVCYERGEDSVEVARILGITLERLAEAHSSAKFTVAAVGFCPGFAYLSGLPELLRGLDRRPQPRARVEPGSVAITGAMSAVYPSVRPGGWWLIGRTPLTIVDEAEGYFPLQVGDRVRFRAVSPSEARHLEGQRL
ncbi:MAG: carboxyltransferase domain-containing protein [Fimbriimonadaceae bacterium]|nr:carboxyltransferase domain-containing protein [Fimbriimonadaceae bacterium]QYK57688.1 MAG: carboxyltransferase domain-containing protein [Fimbriimonadaceae bacterium]